MGRPWAGARRTAARIADAAARSRRIGELLAAIHLAALAQLVGAAAIVCARPAVAGPALAGALAIYLGAAYLTTMLVPVFHWPEWLNRLSVFDVILPDPVPDKGRVLTAISAFWFEAMGDLIPNHVLAVDPAGFPDGVGPEFAGRSMLVEVTTPVRMECIARGHLFGGAWKEYREQGTVQGRPMPAGMQEAEPLPEPLFTPTSKPEEGHDLPITDAEAIALVGADRFEEIRASVSKVIQKPYSSSFFYNCMQETSISPTQMLDLLLSSEVRQCICRIDASMFAFSNETDSGQA